MFVPSYSTFPLIIIPLFSVICCLTLLCSTIYSSIVYCVCGSHPPPGAGQGREGKASGSDPGQDTSTSLLHQEEGHGGGGANQHQATQTPVCPQKQVPYQGLPTLPMQGDSEHSNLLLPSLSSSLSLFTTTHTIYHHHHHHFSPLPPSSPPLLTTILPQTPRGKPLSELNRAPPIPTAAMEPDASLQSITYDKFKVSIVEGPALALSLVSSSYNLPLP